MFKIDDFIMYGTTGVCKVIDIKKESIINNIEKEYYVLSYLYSRDTIIKIPVDNEKVNMRKIITRSELTQLIANMPQKEVFWEEDEKTRIEQLKLMIKTGNVEEFISIIKSIYLDKDYKNFIGKRPYKNDLEIMENTERLLNEEFATVLNISPCEVTSYILNNLSQ